MIRVTEYDATTGRLGMMLTFPDEATYLINQPAGSAFMAGHHDAGVYYALDGQVAARPTQTTALSGFTFTGLPTPSTLWIDHASYAVTDSTVTLDLPLPGTYPLRVEAWPYIDWTGSVTV